MFILGLLLPLSSPHTSLSRSLSLSLSLSLRGLGFRPCPFLSSSASPRDYRLQVAVLKSACGTGTRPECSIPRMRRRASNIQEEDTGQLRRGPFSYPSTPLIMLYSVPKGPCLIMDALILRRRCGHFPGSPQDQQRNTGNPKPSVHPKPLKTPETRNARQCKA